MTDRERDARESLTGPEWAALERALDAAPASAPALFSDRVMARVAVTPQRPAQPAAGWIGAPALAWWVRAAAEPAVVLSLSLAALVMWRGASLMPAFEAGAAWLEAAPGAAASRLGLGALNPILSHGTASLALALALLPAVAWSSWRLCQWLEGTSLPMPRTLFSR